MLLRLRKRMLRMGYWRKTSLICQNILLIWIRLHGISTLSANYLRIVFGGKLSKNEGSKDETVN